MKISPVLWSQSISWGTKKRRSFLTDSLDSLSVLFCLLFQCVTISHVLSPGSAFHHTVTSLGSLRPNTWFTGTPLTLLLTYLWPWLPVEHRPSTTPRHHTLFWAAVVILDQLVPCCFSSASVSHLQLLWGRPLFLFDLFEYMFFSSLW